MGTPSLCDDSRRGLETTFRELFLFLLSNLLGCQAVLQETDVKQWQLT